MMYLCFALGEVKIKTHRRNKDDEKGVSEVCAIVEKYKQECIDESQREANIILAKKMIARNEPMEKIIDYTSLTEEEIENLR